MKAQGFTTITSVKFESAVISCPASRAYPSITSPSTRFFGQPSETKPTFMTFLSGVHPVEHPRVWNRFAKMLQAANPAHDGFDAHAEAAVRHGAVAAQVKV